MPDEFLASWSSRFDQNCRNMLQKWTSDLDYNSYWPDLDSNTPDRRSTEQILAFTVFRARFLFNSSDDK